MSYDPPGPHDYIHEKLDDISRTLDDIAALLRTLGALLAEQKKPRRKKVKKHG